MRALFGKLQPIEVKGSGLYDHTGKEWRAVAIGMPNVGNDVSEWIKVLQRVKTLGPELNAIRIYLLPDCATSANSTCFQ